MRHLFSFAKNYLTNFWYLLQFGVNLVYIRDLRSHSDISITEIYARADEKMKRKALMEVYNSPACTKKEPAKNQIP